MNRNLLKVFLPISKITVSIISYWSWGEKQELQRFLISGVNIDLASGADPKMNNFDAVKGIDLKKKVLELAVKEVVSEDGTVLKVEDLQELPDSDVEFLLEEINKLDSEKKN